MSGTGTSGVQHKLRGAEKRAEKALRDPEAEKKFGMQVAAISAVVGGIPLAEIDARRKQAQSELLSLIHI